MKYVVHEFRFKKYLDKEVIQKTLEQFLNALKGKVSSIIPVPPRNSEFSRIELLLIIEEIEEY